MTKTMRAEDAFQELLEGGRAPAELESLAKLAVALKQQAPVTARPEFRANLRATLLAEASATDEDRFAAALAAPRAQAPAQVRALVAIAAALQPASLPEP